MSSKIHPAQKGGQGPVEPPTFCFHATLQIRVDPSLAAEQA
jgi:hypothetical protein